MKILTIPAPPEPDWHARTALIREALDNYQEGEAKALIATLEAYLAEGISAPGEAVPESGLDDDL